MAPAEIFDATTPEHLSEIRALFIEYAESLSFELCFQNFDTELVELPGRYAPPGGVLLLAEQGGIAAGCIALRKLDAGACEMKRLYVRSAFRGMGLGKRLATTLIERARAIGYERMRLDTTQAMVAAIGLYESLGFTDIPPYCHNPIAGARYMELAL